MEKNITANLKIPTYAKQLDEISYHLANLNFLRAITRCYHLIDQLIEVLSHTNKEAKPALNEALSGVYKLLQNSYFNWLVSDPCQFCQNQKAKKDLLKNLKQATTMYYFSAEEKQHSQFLAYFIQLLFSHSMERSDLQSFRIIFCDLYDGFMQNNRKFNQALVLLGLALIAAYEGDLSSTYQGLNHAATTYPDLHKLVKAIHYQLPHTMSVIDEDRDILTNPLANFHLPEIASSLQLRP